jgi:hypothetical protein
MTQIALKTKENTSERNHKLSQTKIHMQMILRKVILIKYIFLPHNSSYSMLQEGGPFKSIVFSLKLYSSMEKTGRRCKIILVQGLVVKQDPMHKNTLGSTLN